MRMLLTVQMSTAKANQAVRDNTLGQTIGKILEQTKPEAAYFGERNGMRTGFLVYDLKSADKIPFLAEPWFLAFDAIITITPVMLPEDVMRAGPDIEQASKTYLERA